ncbi:MAG: restriction endonuclease subunit S [Candidatus Nanopelagicales bacterium]
MNEEWRQSTLGEVCEVVGGGTPSTKEPTYWGGDIIWLSPTEVVRQDGGRISESERTITDVGLARSSAKLVPPGTVLLTTRASVGFVAIADCALATNQGFQSLICGSELIPEFLMYWVQANREEFRRRAGGSTFPEVSKAKVKDIPISYPPLPVQRRIVDLMEHLDNQVNALNDEADTLDEMYTLSLRDLLSARGEIPLTDVVSRVRAGGTPSRKRPDFYGGAIPWLKSGEVNRDHIGATSETITDAGLAASSTWLVPHGSVVLAMYGQGDTKGTAGYLDVPMCTNQAVLALVPDAQRCDGRFLLHWMRSHTDRLRAAASGAAQPNLSKEVVLRVTRFPCLSVQEQRRIAAVLDAQRDTWRHLSQESEHVRHLRGQLLASLLSGVVEIPEAYDEVLGVAS